MATIFGFRVMPRLLEIKNVICMKWCAPTEWQYREMLRFYGDRLAFVDNMNVHVWSHGLPVPCGQLLAGT